MAIQLLDTFDAAVKALGRQHADFDFLTRSI
jgi:hypothetical protein